MTKLKELRFNIDNPNPNENKQELLNNLIKTEFNHDNIKPVKIDGLKFPLKNYQQDAVNWMVHREDVLTKNTLHPL